MHEKTLVLVDADRDSVGAVLEAAARTGHAVRLARGSAETHRILDDDPERIAGLIVDLDPGEESLALLKAINGRHARPPVITLTGWEESHMKPVAIRHGAVDCLGKPLSIDRLEVALNRLAWPRREEISCDTWGHPLSGGQLPNECLVGG